MTATINQPEHFTTHNWTYVQRIWGLYRALAITIWAVGMGIVSSPAQVPAVSFAGVHTSIRNSAGGNVTPDVIAVDGAGNVYITRLADNIPVIRLTPGVGATVLLSGFWSVDSLAVDQSGNTWVCAARYEGTAWVNHLLKIDPSGNITDINIADFAAAVTADYSGNVYFRSVAGTNFFTYIIPPGTSIPRLFSVYGSRLAMAVDQTGSLFYVEGISVMKAAPPCNDPSCTSELPPPVEVASFPGEYPTNLALDRFGNLFIETSTWGIYELPAGCTSNSCRNNNPIGNAQSPPGMAVNANGDFFSGAASPDVAVLQFRAADFYNIAVKSSATLTLNFTINSAVALGATPAVLTQGISGLDFALSGSTCIGVQTAGGTCTVTVSFSPRAPGLRMGSVQLKDSAGNTLVTVPLRGVGIAPAVAFATGPQTMLALSVASDVAVDAGGNIFIADTSTKSVLKIPAACSGTGCQTTVATGLVDPSKLAVDGAGAMFVADTGANRVVKIPADCTTTACQTTVGSGLSQPDGVALDGSGNVYISDFGHQRVVAARDNCSGSFCQTTLISGIDSPEGLALSTQGELFVTQSSKNQVVFYPAGCTTTACPTTIGTGLLFPTGVAVNAGGTVLMTNDFGNQVIELPSNCRFGGCQTTVSSGSGPFGVSSDSVGNIFVAYAASHEVDKVSRTAAATLVLPTTFVSHKSSSQTVTLENIGNTRLDFSGISTSVNFAVDPASTTCQTSLLPGISCSIGVSCAPTVGGSLTGALTISDNALNQNATQLVPLACSATGSQQQVSFTGAPAAAPYQSTFTVSASTVSTVMPIITSSGGCSVSNVSGTPAATSATITMISGTVACSLSASWAEDSNYAAATLAQTTIAQLAAPTVTFTGAPSTAKAFTTFTVNATSNAGTTPVIATNTPKCAVANQPGQVSGTTIAMLTGTGSCIVTATWAAVGNYTGASLSQSILAEKADPQLLFYGAPATASYMDTFTLTAVTNATTQAVITTTGSCSNTGTTVTITSSTGVCSMKADWAADNNFASASANQTTNIGKASQTITFTMAAPPVAAFNSSFTVAGTASSGLPIVLSVAPASLGVCSLSGPAVVMLSGSGTCTINADQPGNANYNPAGQVQTSAAASRIDQVALVLNAGSPLTYLASESLSATGGSLPGSAIFGVTSGSCSVSGSQLTANSGTGSCVVKATKVGNANYNDATVSVTVVLAKSPQTITFNQPASPAAFGTTFSAQASSDSGISVSVTAAGGCSISSGTVKMTSGSTACVLTASQAGDSNYSAAQNVVRTVSASLATLTITADPRSKLYLAALPVFSVQYSGFKGTDAPSVLTGSLSCATTATVASTIGNYPITCSGLTTPNYTINWVPGQLTVLPLPVVSTVTLSAASAQYSDKITIGVSIPNAGGLLPAAGMNFKIGSIDLATVPVSANGVNYTGSVLSQQLTQAPGSYTITASFVNPDPNYVLSFTPNSLGLTLTAEDARTTYTGSAYFTTSSPTTYTATIPISFTIYDITTAGPYTAGTATTPATGDREYDDWAGNIRNATVKVVDALTNTTLCATATLGPVTPGDNTTATATCSFTASLPTSGASAGFQTYAPQVVVGGYYVDAEAVTEQSLITVALPLTSDFVSASGSVEGTASSGLLPAALGSKMHFGLNVKYNKSGTNLQGSAFVIVRSTMAAPGDTCPADVDGYHVYRFKSNSITTVTTQPSGTAATSSVLGNASIIDITSNGTSTCAYSIDGGATLQITMTDRGSTGDSIGITVWQAANKGGGLWFSTNWVNGKTAELPTTNGNVSVH